VVSRDPLLILDGAHNPGAIRYLSEAIREVFDTSALSWSWDYGGQGCGDYSQGIVSMANHVVFTRPEYYGSRS